MKKNKTLIFLNFIFLIFTVISYFKRGRSIFLLFTFAFFVQICYCLYDMHKNKKDWLKNMKEKVKNLMLNPAMQMKIIASFFIFMLFIKSYVDTSFILSLIDEVILTYFIINFVFLFVNKNKVGKQLKKRLTDVVISALPYVIGRLISIVIIIIIKVL